MFKTEKGINSSLDSEQGSVEFLLSPVDNRRLANLRGQLDENLRLLEAELAVTINNRGNFFQISGSQIAADKAARILKELYRQTTAENCLAAADVQLLLKDSTLQATKGLANSLSVRTKQGPIKARSAHQQAYIDAIDRYDLTFGVGPAGTGKTFLAVACAVQALEAQQVRRILLVRPAVEAGERLGFLPGDLSQKIDPYCRPLYDALADILGFEQVSKLLDRQIIEVAPLAYMRGRTLTDAFIILDEGQNTTVEQMKMFLTRMGYNCTVVVTGDVTQIDLPRGQQSGLKHCIEVLKNINDIGFIHFNSQDVVRHSLVQRIIDAYHENNSENH